MTHWIYGNVFQVCCFLMVVLDDSAYFKGDGVECENIWHNSQVTFLNIVLLWFCMGGDPHSIVALGKAVGRKGSRAPDSKAHTAPRSYETRGCSHCFPSACLWTNPVLAVFQIAFSVPFTKQWLLLIKLLSTFPMFPVFLSHVAILVSSGYFLQILLAKCGHFLIYLKNFGGFRKLKTFMPCERKEPWISCWLRGRFKSVMRTILGGFSDWRIKIW